MKNAVFCSALALLAGSRAFVIPDPKTTEFGASLQNEADFAVQDGGDYSIIKHSLDQVQDRARPIVDRFTEFVEGAVASAPSFHHRDQTVFDCILNSKYFTKLAKVVREDEELTELLKSTPEHGITLFAPPDHAIPSHHGDNDKDFLAAFGIDEFSDNDRHGPPKELLRAVVKYHVIPSYGYSFEALRSGYNVTLATALTSEKGYLNGEPQRLSVGLLGLGVKLNVFSEIVVKYANRKCTNGFVHPISRPLIPPPNMMQILWFAPQLFSTLTTAIQKVNLTSIFETKAKEFTAFGPINTAWDALPPKALAFLFSPYGEKYLSGLLAYHTTPLHYITPDYHHVGKPDDDEDKSSVFVDMLESALGSFSIPCKHARKHAHQQDSHDVEDTNFGKTVHHHYRVPTALTMLVEHPPKDSAMDVEDFASTISRIMSKDGEDDDEMFDLHHGHGKLDTYLYVDTYRTIVAPKFARLPRLAPAGSVKVNGQTVAVNDVVAKNGVAHAIGKVLIPRRVEEDE